MTILPKGAYGVNLGCFGTFGTFRAFVACTSPKKFLAGLLMLSKRAYLSLMNKKTSTEVWGREVGVYNKYTANDRPKWIVPRRIGLIRNEGKYGNMEIVLSRPFCPMINGLFARRLRTCDCTHNTKRSYKIVANVYSFDFLTCGDLRGSQKV